MHRQSLHNPGGRGPPRRERQPAPARLRAPLTRSARAKSPRPAASRVCRIAHNSSSATMASASRAPDHLRSTLCGRCTLTTAECPFAHGRHDLRRAGAAQATQKRPVTPAPPKLQIAMAPPPGLADCAHRHNRSDVTRYAPRSCAHTEIIGHTALERVLVRFWRREKANGRRPETRRARIRTRSGATGAFRCGGTATSGSERPSRRFSSESELCEAESGHGPLRTTLPGLRFLDPLFGPL